SVRCASAAAPRTVPGVRAASTTTATGAARIEPIRPELTCGRRGSHQSSGAPRAVTDLEHSGSMRKPPDVRLRLRRDGLPPGRAHRPPFRFRVRVEAEREARALGDALLDGFRCLVPEVHEVRNHRPPPAEIERLALAADAERFPVAGIDGCRVLPEA